MQPRKGDEADDRPAPAELPRLLQILRVLASTGWAHYVERLRVGRTMFGMAAESAKTDIHDAKRFREMLEGLGPAFIKFGQLLSLRRDLLPESFIDELQRLQDNVSIFPGAQARAIIERELASPVAELFAEFDESPLAAASIGQVHTARLKDGTSVVVKVQRPGIEPIIHTDVSIMRFLARRLELHVPESRRFGPTDLVEEFARCITDELDYHIEARSGDRLRENLADDADVFVPLIYWDMTSQRVLTMERSQGHKLVQQMPTDLIDRQRIAEKLMHCYLKQVFEHGFFHGDPHPGNVFILSDGRLCFHDFGIMGELSAHDQDALAQLILAVSSEEVSWMVDAYFEMGVAAEEVDRQTFTYDVAKALKKYYEAAGRGYSFSEIVRQFTQLSQRHQIRVPRQFLLVSKAFMAVESQALTLDPNFNVLASLHDYVPHLLARRIQRGFNRPFVEFSRSFRTLRSLHRAATNLPDMLNRAVDVLSSGKATLHIEHDQLEGLEAHIDRGSNRLSLSLIIASVVIGSSIVMAFHSGPHYLGIPLLGLVGFVVATVMGLAWAIAILRSGRL
ncbi:MULTISPECIES: AarF/ABC1/UbiB kinase family protein [unclassified Cupriavidus]|uniref:ABC1 kinase family protein n=1 Tax=unclassified Cupriavidus TaxID=2640874 RepID=UPI00055B4650|nr:MULTISPECIES: AarF/ABC1/UbiB kinase family protein [unclassified Cupriavidus]MBP0633561.1 AarF/ABC1/UbiB kinase family protein [Cupriavidus sp. AcVe19-1a]